jgi:hypothetical protein
MLERGFNDISTDPLNWSALLSAAGMGPRTAGRAVGTTMDQLAERGILATGGRGYKAARTFAQGAENIGTALHYPQSVLDRGPDVMGNIIKGSAYGVNKLSGLAETRPVVGAPFRGIRAVLTRATQLSDIAKARIDQEEITYAAQKLVETMRRGWGYYGEGSWMPGRPATKGSAYPTPPGGTAPVPGQNWDGLTPPPDVPGTGPAVPTTDPYGRPEPQPGFRMQTLRPPGYSYNVREISSYGGQIGPQRGAPNESIYFRDYNVVNSGLNVWGVIDKDGALVKYARDKRTATAWLNKNPWVEGGQVRQFNKPRWTLTDKYGVPLL